MSGRKLRTSEVGLVIALVIGAAAGVFMALWVQSGWIVAAVVALIVFGGIYEGWIKMAAYQNMADRK
jgi:presenilin-like A22 family membrane protease